MTSLARVRQQHLLAALPGDVEVAVISAPEHVYYLTGLFPAWRLTPALLIDCAGHTTLVWPNGVAESDSIDRCETYVAHFAGTLRIDQSSAVATVVERLLAEKPSRSIGFDSSPIAACLIAARLNSARQFVSIDPILHAHRRAKHADELLFMRRAIAAAAAMYQAAKRVIAPGVPELTVFNTLHAAAVNSTGAPMTALLGNDFACGVAGGPARAGRVAQAGELYILDLGPTFQGYFSDTCRTFSVDRKPSPLQVNTHAAIADCFPLIERLAKPGVACRDLCAAIEDHLRTRLDVGLSHHLGHGVGLSPHEMPYLNPKSDHVLQPGDTFTAEPGVYSAALAGGIRLENQYLVTDDGVENLTSFEMSLT